MKTAYNLYENSLTRFSLRLSKQHIQNCLHDKYLPNMPLIKLFFQSGLKDY